MADEAKQKIESEEIAADEAGEETAPEEETLETATDPDSESGAGPEAEVAKLREALLRAHAEMNNVQKRSAREIEKSRRFALERFAKDLVPVIDSLDQALANGAAEPESEEAQPDGMRLVYRQLVGVLERHGLEVIDPADQPFDPSWHEAMTMQPSGEVEPNTVLQVLQKGFKLHDRLLRPARVIVSRAPD